MIDLAQVGMGLWFGISVPVFLHVMRSLVIRASLSAEMSPLELAVLKGWSAVLCVFLVFGLFSFGFFHGRSNSLMATPLIGLLAGCATYCFSYCLYRRVQKRL